MSIVIILPLIVVAIVAIIIAVYTVNHYNKILELRNAVHNIWKQIDVQLKRNYDLITDIVNATKDEIRYTDHENETLTSVMKARNGLVSGTPLQRVHNHNQIQEVLKSVFALAESYPDLKTNKDFIRLQDEIIKTKNNITYSCQHCNKKIVEYNNRREIFPTTVIVQMLKFTYERPLPIPETKQENLHKKEHVQ